MWLGNIKAREHLKTAFKLDPDYVGALSGIAWTHFVDGVYGWSDSPSSSIERAFEFVQKALKLDEQHAMTHSLLGQIYNIQGNYEKAIAEGKRAIILNPNLATAYGLLAFSMAYAGQFDEAIILH